VTDWRPTLFLFFALCDFALVMMASDYGLSIATGGSPITAEQYVEAVYAVPAVIWAALPGGGSIMGTVGAVMVAARVHQRFGAFLLALGNLFLAILFSTFAFLSRDAEMGILLHSLAKHPGFLIYGAIAVVGLRLLIWGEKN
jgi:hypothetical protein